MSRLLLMMHCARGAASAQVVSKAITRTNWFQRAATVTLQSQRAKKAGHSFKDDHREKECHDGGDHRYPTDAMAAASLWLTARRAPEPEGFT
jgi:hypothetical protein